MKNVIEIINKLSLEGLLATSASILALLIPLAIFLIENNGNVNDRSFKWDKMVIFSQVMDIKKTILGLILITVPLIFWKINILKPLILVTYIFGIYFMWILLKNSYDWIVSKYTNGKYFRNEKRFSYLDNLENSQVIYDTWKLIWETEDQRIGLDEIKLIEKYFISYDNFKDKEKFLYLFTSQLKVDRGNQDTIQKFFYKEFSRITEDMKNKNYKESALFMELQISYLNYMNQCYADGMLVYNFIKSFDDFFSKTDAASIKLFFTNDLDIRMIETIRNSTIIPDPFFNLQEYLPHSFQYEVVEEDKKKIVSNIFSKWISFFYKNKDSEFFATTLFELMFKKADPNVFFRLTEFVLYFGEHIYSYGQLINNTEVALIDYSNEKTIFVALGRSHTFWGENDKKTTERFMEINKQEKEWSYEYILKLENREFIVLQSSELLNKLVTVIDEILNKYNQDSNLEINRAKLQILRNDFTTLIDLINKKRK
ncbi:hypothetical protein [Enterococcus spodopteracolus]|uniref:hypothetical protein n=1 Tax=Enterococcus spodopteracolus TaxID=3034501 RepID=UPI002649246E|nr:hypothetical protein [Enterococcus spodopteracolus]